MKIRDIIHEDLGSAVASAIVGATDEFMNIFDVPPTQKQSAVNDMMYQWDQEWTKIVQNEPDAKSKYGLALRAWLQGIFKEDPQMQNFIKRKLDVSKTVQGGRPNERYIKNVFALIFDAEKKRSKRVSREPFSAKPTVRMKAATAK